MSSACCIIPVLVFLQTVAAIPASVLQHQAYSWGGGERREKKGKQGRERKRRRGERRRGERRRGERKNEIGRASKETYKKIRYSMDYSCRKNIRYALDFSHSLGVVYICSWFLAV